MTTGAEQQPPRGKFSKRRLAIGCFVLALTLRLGLLFGTGEYRIYDHSEMWSVAATFARTGQIANGYMSLPTGPTAHVAPVYPILLGSVFRVFGTGDTGEHVKQILACGISSARAALLVLLALAFGFREGNALAAGLLSAIYIGAFETELKGDWEGPLAANALLLLVLWGYRLARHRIPAPAVCLLYGIAWGVALLISPSLITAGAGLVLLACGRSIRVAPRATFAAVTAVAAGCLLALSPWIVRNYVELGGFVWGRDNLGLELSVSNGPGAHWSNPKNRDRIFSMHPSRYPPAARNLVAQGELAFHEERRQEAIKWIRENPREFAVLTWQRVAHFWFPEGRNRAHQFVLAAFTLLAFLGLFLLRMRGSPAFPIVAVIWVAYPLLYYVIQWSSRYRQPIDWSLVLCASVAIYEGGRAIYNR